MPPPPSLCDTVFAKLLGAPAALYKLLVPTNPKFSRAQGASSGIECYPIALALIGCAAYWHGSGLRGLGAALGALLLFQLLVMHRFDRDLMFTSSFSQKLGPSIMRNGSIGFAECVRPGGKPTADHCLALYSYSAPLSSAIFGSVAVAAAALNPVVALLRLTYPEHWEGVNRGRHWDLFVLFLRHPVVVQGEGPSNGDGLAAMCASESLIYPITRRRLEQGDKDAPYWTAGEPGTIGAAGAEARPRLRDMFHDKVFCHRFFDAHGAPHPVLVAEVEGHEVERAHVRRDDAERMPAELIWKPRYSTMSLGVEHFTGWKDDDDNNSSTKTTTSTTKKAFSAKTDKEGVKGQGEQQPPWAPSADPYIIEEFLRSTDAPAAEWFRMPTLWPHDSDAPRPSYFWRARNDTADARVQTDIIGGQYCVPTGVDTFVGPKAYGTVFDPRTGEESALDADVDTALAGAAAAAVQMHRSLGKELYSIGWDVMVVGDVAYFIEFNINNGCASTRARTCQHRVLRAACCVLRAACCVLAAGCCVLRAARPEPAAVVHLPAACP